MLEKEQNICKITEEMYAQAKKLDEAISKNDTWLLSQFLIFGFNVNTKYGSDCATALMYAAELGMQGCVKVLIEAGSDVNVQNKYGFTPIMYSIISRSVECIKTLLQHGAKIDLCNSQNQNALAFAKMFYRLKDHMVCTTSSCSDLKKAEIIVAIKTYKEIIQLLEAAGQQKQNTRATSL